VAGENHLTSFEVEGFRAIRRLHLPELAQVNVFVGENNAGKTSLLEALRMYASRTPAAELLGIIREHAAPRPGPGSLASPATMADPQELRWAIDSCLQVLSGRFDGSPAESVHIRNGDPHRSVTVRLPWLSDYAEGNEAGLFFTMQKPLIELSRSGESVNLTLEWLLRSLPLPPRTGETGVVHVPAGGFESHDLYFMWRDAAAAGDADVAEAAIAEVLPSFERVFVLNDALYLKLRNVSRPIPLESMGDGTSRIVGVALALVRARDGAVLVDEVENGLHHTIQADVWAAIFGLAQRLNVQVFATTHSWDAVFGFQHAATASLVDGMLYRLEREPGGEIYAERYTEKEISVAARHQIEVR
jgi:hypothetical protein